jgi:hypothetical protein
MSLPGLTFLESALQMPLMSLPVRSTVVQLSSARVLHSPGSKLTPEALRSAGAVTDIVAPSLLHLDGMPAAAAAHPGARLWGPAGCREKKPEVRWTGILGEDAWPHEAELSLLPLEGQPKLREWVLLHRPSRTLLVTDLVFNMQDAKGVGPWLILHLFGTWRKLGISRLFLKYAEDRAAFRASLARVLAEDFDNLVPAHGHVATGGARERLRAAMQERGL